MVYDHRNPTEVIPDMIWAPGGTLPPDRKAEHAGVQVWSRGEDVKELCRTCGWNTYHELTSCYIPRMRIEYTKMASGMWSIGPDWLIWDRPNEVHLGNDSITYQFLRSKGVKMPLVKEMRELSAPTDPVQFTLMSRAKGVPLDTIWHTLAREEKTGYKKQMIDILRELRQFTSPSPQKVDGTPLHDKIVGRCTSPATCKSIGKTTDEWFSNIAEELRHGLMILHKTQDPAVIDEKFKELKYNFPEGGPYVLTHGDLNFCNIIVNDGKIEAIIDWERAGYYPWWAERWFWRKWANKSTDIFFERVWKELYPEINDEAFSETVMKKVAQVIRAWKACPIEHSEMRNVWYRPAFCKCNPCGGTVDQRFLGAKLEHKIDYRSVEDRVESTRQSLEGL